MADIFYNAAKSRLGGGDTLWNSGTIKLLLVTSAYTPAATDLFVSTAVASSAEIVATNYTGGFGGAGRKTVGTKTHSVNQGANRGEFFGIVPTWVALGGATNATIAGAVLYEEISTDAASPLLSYYTVTPATTSNGGDFSLQWTSNLMLTLT